MCLSFHIKLGHSEDPIFVFSSILKDTVLAWDAKEAKWYQKETGTKQPRKFRGLKAKITITDVVYYVLITEGNVN